jgi:hypothetical protein
MADVTGLAQKLRDLKSHYSGIQGGEEQMYRHVTDYARNQGLTANDVAQVAQQVAPNPGAWDARRVQGIMDRYDTRGQSYGLNPAFQTLQQGATDASGRIAQTQERVKGLYDQGLGMLNPYMQGGGQAHDLQAALSGAMGPEAQQKAFDSYSSSPGVQFAVKEGERGLLRNAAATGGLGGGNVLRDLMAYGTGMAQQDFGNQFNRIGEVANRGYGAATTGAGMQGQHAQVQAGLGQFNANSPLQTSQAQAGMQFQTGRDISSNINSTSSALSALINQQGAGMADITGQAAGNLNQLYQLASQGDSNAIQQLQAMLGNLSTQSASMVGGQPIIPGQQTNYLGQVGQVAGGIGGLATGLGAMNPASQPVYGPLPPTYGLDASSTAFSGYA